MHLTITAIGIDMHLRDRGSDDRRNETFATLKVCLSSNSRSMDECGIHALLLPVRSITL